MRITGIVLIIVSVLQIGVHTQSVEVPPEDTIARVGEDVLLTCQVGRVPTGRIDALEWERNVPGSDDPEHIYTSVDGHGNRVDAPANTEKYEIQGTYDLLVKNLELGDGALYTCRFLLNHGIRGSASLVVIDDVTVGVTTIDEGATEALTCTASYGGYLPVDEESWFTKLRMLMDGIVVEENYLVDRETSTMSVMYQYIGNAVDDNTDLSCEVYSDTQEDVVTSRKVLNVLHGTKDISVLSGIEGAVVGTQETFIVGEILNCTANGYPTPVIQWVRVEDNVQTDVIRSANLELTEDMVGENTWLCEARNHYGGEDYHQNKNYTFVVEGAAGYTAGASSSSLSPGLIVVAVVVPIVVIAVVVIGAFFFIRRRNNSKPSEGKVTFDNDFPARQLSHKQDIIRSPEEVQPLNGHQKLNMDDTMAVKMALDSIDEGKPQGPPPPKPVPRSRSRENLSRSRDNIRHQPPEYMNRIPPHLRGGRESTDGSVMSDSDNYPKLQHRLPPSITPDNTSTPRSETPSNYFTSDTETDTTLRGSDLDSTLTSNDPRRARGNPPHPQARRPRQRSRSRERPVGIKVLPTPSLDASRDTDV